MRVSKSWWLIAVALCLPLQAVEPVHTESSGSGRPSAAPAKEWTYQGCQTWNDRTQKSEPSSFTVDIEEKPATWLAFRSLKANLRSPGLNLKLDMALGYEDGTLAKQGIKGYSSQTDGELNGKWFRPSSVYRTSSDGKEKVLMVTTELPTRKGGFNQFRVVMLSNQGDLVQAQLSFQGPNFLALRVEKVCGRGFGGVRLLDGQAKPASSGNGQVPESIGHFPSSLPTKTAIRRRVMAEQMSYVDYFLRQELARANQK